MIASRPDDRRAPLRHPAVVAARAHARAQPLLCEGVFP